MQWQTLSQILGSRPLIYTMMSNLSIFLEQKTIVFQIIVGQCLPHLSQKIATELMLSLSISCNEMLLTNVICV